MAPAGLEKARRQPLLQAAGHTGQEAVHWPCLGHALQLRSQGKPGVEAARPRRPRRQAPRLKLGRGDKGAELRKSARGAATGAGANFRARGAEKRVSSVDNHSNPCLYELTVRQAVFVRLGTGRDEGTDPGGP